MTDGMTIEEMKDLNAYHLCGNPMHGDREAAVAFPRDIPSPFIQATKENRWQSNLFTYRKESQ